MREADRAQRGPAITRRDADGRATEVRVIDLEGNAQTYAVGCYIDGHWGWRGISRLAELFPTFALAAERDALREYASDECDQTDDDIEYAIAAADVIEQRLNDALPDGIVAHWFDGEFFLSRTCAAAGTDEPCDDLECFCQCG